jgi:hypothetical protein
MLLYQNKTSGLSGFFSEKLGLKTTLIRQTEVINKELAFLLFIKNEFSLKDKLLPGSEKASFC